MESASLTVFNTTYSFGRGALPDNCSYQVSELAVRLAFFHSVLSGNHIIIYWESLKGLIV